MPVSPQVCCAAGVCCDPPDARLATIDILKEAGVDDRCCDSVADWLTANKIVLFDANVAESIRAMIDAHNSE